MVALVSAAMAGASGTATAMLNEDRGNVADSTAPAETGTAPVDSVMETGPRVKVARATENVRPVNVAPEMESVRRVKVASEMESVHRVKVARVMESARPARSVNRLSERPASAPGSRAIH